MHRKREEEAAENAAWDLQQQMVADVGVYEQEDFAYDGYDGYGQPPHMGQLHMYGGDDEDDRLLRQLHQQWHHQVCVCVGGGSLGEGSCAHVVFVIVCVCV